MVGVLPSQFPCLVKAIYSYAGESKGDLGFVQGDLIDCLNAGDGQWWFGRLKRNHTMGVFPSNYVELVDERPSSKDSNGIGRPTSSHSQMRPSSRHSERPISRQSERRSLRSVQSFGHDLGASYRPSSSSDRRTQLHAARSMTSMSQYQDNHPRYSGRSPSPAFYAVQDRYGSYNEPDDDLNYPVDNVGYTYDDHYDHQRRQSVSPRPRSAAGNHIERTPSPLRWAMQDLMDSLDTMAPHLPSAPSPQPDFYDRHDMLHEEQVPAWQSNSWNPEDQFRSQSPLPLEAEEAMPPYMYPTDMRPPPLLNYVDRMQSKLDRFQNYHYSPERHERSESVASNYYEQERPASRISNVSDLRPRSSHSMNKPLPSSPSFQPPMPPPHKQRHRETESNTSHSAKNSIFSSATSDYSTVASSVSNASAGSAGSFARKKLHLQRQQQQPEVTSQRTALSVLPKGTLNGGALKRRKSYGSSLKKTIGKLLNTSPSKPPPGTVSDHGGKVIEWQNVRRDVNRANSPSPQERMEHRERLEMSEGVELIRPIELLERIVEGDESANGSPILPDETFDISRVNFSLIDRATRLVNQIPPQYLSSPASFAKAVICRPYTSEIQRLRAIFVFLSEKFTWEPLHPSDGFEQERSPGSLQKLFETRRGSAEDIAWCFWEMCQGCNIHAEVIPGHLKSPFNEVDADITPQQNHFWNAVMVNGEWRMVDASLASPTHPSRPPPMTKSMDPFYFLSRPSEFLYTHIPLGDPHHQHVLAQEIVHPGIQLALPYACPAYFQHDLALQSDFDIAQTRLEGLQVACIDIEVPDDVECVAEVESQIYSRDPDGDLFESGEVIREPALAQPLWLDGGQRRCYRVKGFVNGEGSKGTLRIFAGKKGLMTSALDNPHRLALTIPLSQHGSNPPFRFLTRHPTPHAQRHDLYIRQPQCKELRMNQTYIFSVLQSPSSSSSQEVAKPAKLSIQTPGGKLIKLTNRIESEDGSWEALIKCSEKGSWKGLVLGATARWCVFAEWHCQG